MKPKTAVKRAGPEPKRQIVLEMDDLREILKIDGVAVSYSLLKALTTTTPANRLWRTERSTFGSIPIVYEVTLKPWAVKLLRLVRAIPGAT